LGEKIDVVLGFVNNGKESFNVSAAQASLMHPTDAKTYVQNVSKS
jgi:hypothetical protein